MGDPPRKLVTRYLRWFVRPEAPVAYHALYHLNVADDATAAPSSPGSSAAWSALMRMLVVFAHPVPESFGTRSTGGWSDAEPGGPRGPRARPLRASASIR